MESVYNFSTQEILVFALVLVRITAFVLTMPIFNAQNVPVHAKILFALLIAFVIFPSVGWQKVSADVQTTALFGLVAKEVFVGVTFGFLSRAFFIAMMMAGQLVSISMGISSGQLFNPALGETSSAFDQFYTLLATLFFLAVNGHHLLLSGIIETYKVIGIERVALQFDGLQSVAIMASTVMSIAVQVAAPVLASILFVNVAMALIGRAVPQINILITSLPVNTLAGLIVVLFSMPLLLLEMEDISSISIVDVMNVMKSL